jgi:hypothetical protein
MTPAPRLVICRPPCMWCTDKDATQEVFTTLGCLAELCDEHAEMLRAPRRVGRPIVNAASVGPLLPTEVVAAYLEAQTWTYAKSMPRWPHEYVLLRKSTAPTTHLGAVAFIRAHGEARRWGRRMHHYWQPGDGREYWTMRDSDTILNRRLIGEDEAVAL